MCLTSIELRPRTIKGVGEKVDHHQTAEQDSFLRTARAISRGSPNLKVLNLAEEPGTYELLVKETYWRFRWNCTLFGLIATLKHHK